MENWVSWDKVQLWQTQLILLSNQDGSMGGGVVSNFKMADGKIE